MEKSDRLSRRVWLVNGFIVLAVCVTAVGLLIFAAFSALRQDPESSVRAPAGTAAAPVAPRAVRYGAPVTVRGTATRLVTVHHGKADQPDEPRAYGMYDSGYSGGDYSGQYGPPVNVIFLTPGAPEARLLLDRPAYIRELRYPGASEGGDGMRTPGSPAEYDSLQTWISYEIADRDTNGDGELSAEDRAVLFVSALDGSALRRVLPEPFWLLSHARTPDRRGIVVLALEPPRGVKDPDVEQMRQRSFLYDLASGRLLPYTALEAAADRAARIVGR